MNSSQHAAARRLRPLASGGAALLSAVLGLSLSGCGTSSSQSVKISSATRMSIADIADAGGDIENARTILAAAVAADPDNSELQLRYAQVLLQAGRRDDAIGAARQAVDHDRHDASLAVRAAKLELSAGDPSLAAATFQGAVAAGATGTAALNGLGVARVQLGDLRGAEDAFRHAIAASPGDYAARNNLALALVLQGRADDAVPMLQSLASEPGVPGRVQHNLALAYAQQGNARQAADVLDGVESSSQASREALAFSTLGAQAPTVLASRLAPAEVLQGQTSGTAYAGVIPGPTQANRQLAMADAAPRQSVAALRPVQVQVHVAPLATVQAVPMAAPAPRAAPVRLAAASPPAVASPGASAPVLLPARVVAEPPRVITPQPPAMIASAETTVAEPASVAPLATVAVTEPADDGKIKVRIAVVPTRPAAMAFWQNLAGMVPDLLGGRTPVMRFTRVHGRGAWRLGTGGFDDVAAAEQFCRKLRERGPNCTLGL